jgi:hypothetical protein
MSPTHDSSGSIWSAALLAAGCTANQNGVSTPVQWQSSGDCLYYAASGSVLVLPLDVTMQAGDVLEVGWKAGDTDYSLAILQSGRTRKGNK